MQNYYSQIQTAEDVYNDLYKKKDLFDNSDYSVDSPFYFKENNKVIGKMKRQEFQ